MDFEGWILRIRTEMVRAEADGRLTALPIEGFASRAEAMLDEAFKDEAEWPEAREAWFAFIQELKKDKAYVAKAREYARRQVH